MAGAASPQKSFSTSTSSIDSEEKAQRDNISISVDVVCPSRLDQEGFAVAPLAIQVPAVSVSSLASLFAALKFGSLADEADEIKFLQSVGAQEWVLPQHGVVFAQEKLAGPHGLPRWTAFSSAAELNNSEPLLVCGVREWRHIKSIEAKEEKAAVFHKRKLEEAWRFLLKDRGNGNNDAAAASPRGKALRAGVGSSPSGHELSNNVLAGDGFTGPTPGGTPIGGSTSPGTGIPRHPGPSVEQGPTVVEVAAPPMLLLAPQTSLGIDLGGGGGGGGAATPAGIELPPAAALLPQAVATPRLDSLEEPRQDGSGTAGGGGDERREVGASRPALAPASLGGRVARAGVLLDSRQKSDVVRKRMHKVHGPAFCKMFQMLNIRFIPQGSPTTLRDNSHIVVGYAAKGEEFGRLSNKAATVKMKDVVWTEPGFMGLLAEAGGAALATMKLTERAQRVFARMMSSECMRVVLMWHCAEACSRLCTFGNVYKEKKGMPFDSLAKAFVEEFRLPLNGFPKTEAAALSVLRLPSLQVLRQPPPLPPPLAPPPPLPPRLPSSLSPTPALGETSKGPV